MRKYFKTLFTTQHFLSTIILTGFVCPVNSLNLPKPPSSRLPGIRGQEDEQKRPFPNIIKHLSLFYLFMLSLYSLFIIYIYSFLSIEKNHFCSQCIEDDVNEY